MIGLVVEGLCFLAGVCAAGTLCVLVLAAARRRRLQSEERFQEFFERCPDALVTLEPESGRIVQANAIARSEIGYDADELARKTVADLIVPEELPEAMRNIADLAAGRAEARRTERRLVRRDGSIVMTDCAVTALKDASGEVVRLVACLRNITERKQAEGRIRHLAYFDQLTRLPNRQLLRERLCQALAASAGSGEFGALLLINLDGFRCVNDTLGHAAGDALLRQVAVRLQAEVGEGGTLARVDGDEFMILLEALGRQPVAAVDEAKAFGLQWMRALSGAYALPEGEIHLGCSVGATLLCGQQQTVEDLIRQVNVAVRQAKRAGGNALRFFDPLMQRSLNARTLLEGELRKAVDAGHFLLHYQIQVDPARRVLGAEALLRWNHPRRGLVAPGEFIALAEETRLIVPIGRWVIDAACAQLADWDRHAHTRDLSIAVNVSPLQFQQPDFVAQVLGAIRRHGIAGCRLELELTETLLQGDLERTVETMGALKAQGVRFSLDDFGTGYSSLQYLKQLPLDQLKIDRSFVRDIVTDVNDRAIVGAIIAMSRHINLPVMAEGVETPEQLAVLREYGCSRYQGYLFGRPVPVEQVLAPRSALAS